MPPSSAFPPPPGTWLMRVEPVLHRNGNRHKESTVRQYVRWLWLVYCRVGTRRSVTDERWLEDPTAVLQSLGELSSASLVTYSKAVLNFLQGLALGQPENERVALIYRKWIATYQDLSHLVQKKAQLLRRSQVLPREVDLQAVQQWLKATEADLQHWEGSGKVPSAEERRLLLQHLYVAMMVGSPDFPPIRAEYARMQIVFGATEVPKEPNYIRVPADLRRTGRWEMVLGSYKTMDMYGRHVRDIPAPLREVLRRSLRLFPRTWLLSPIHHPDAPLEWLSNLTEGIVSVPLGASTLRALFIRDYVSKLPLERQLHYAQQMMHNVKTAMNVYRGGAEDDEDSN